MAHIFNRRTYLTHYKAVIGEQVGKSALINKFITGNFISEHVPTTTGMQSSFLYLIFSYNPCAIFCQFCTLHFILLIFLYKYFLTIHTANSILLQHLLLFSILHFIFYTTLLHFIFYIFYY